MDGAAINPERSLHASAYGAAGEGMAWKNVSDLYYNDDVEQALTEAKLLGASFGGMTLEFYRMVEGEALSRTHGRIHELSPTLTLELPRDVDFDVEAIAADMVPAVGEVAARLGWADPGRAWITILVPDADVPWNSARAGYMVDKYPYDKICIPQAALGHPARLLEVVRHEYAHVVILNRTHNRAPIWLQEGIATYMQGVRHDRPQVWESQEGLERDFSLDRRNMENLDAVSDSYRQANALVSYLADQRGDEGLAQLLGAFTNNNLWEEVKIAFGAASADEALHEVYGINQAQLFDLAQPQ